MKQRGSNPPVYTVLHAINKFQQSLKNVNKVYIAMSGGMDSTVLLDGVLKSRFMPEGKLAINKISMVHVDHQLHVHSRLWREGCQRLAKHYGLPCKVHVLGHSPRKGESIEAFAREARYGFFKSLLMPGDLLLTAHHLDDQIETFFIQLLRGSGITGLSGMEMLMPFGEGHLGRPFLGLKRQDLLLYAKTRELKWFDDPSNEDNRFVRNYLRLELLPRIALRFPAYHDTIARSMKHCRSASAVIEEISAQDMVHATEANLLYLKPFKALSFNRQNLLIKAWIRKNTGLRAGTALLHEIQKAISAKNDASPCVSFSNYELRRDLEKLIIREKDG